MSLYNDLKPLQDDFKSGSNLSLKRYANYAPPPNLLKAGRTGRGGRGPGGGRGQGLASLPSSQSNGALKNNQSYDTLGGLEQQETPQAKQSLAQSLNYSIFAPFGYVNEEYDPARPNDYEKLLQEREKKRWEAQMKAEILQKQKEQEEQEKREKELQLQAGEAKNKGMSLAQKMLEKFGWKEGEGLGKTRQGIIAPLVAQKTDSRSGIIMTSKEVKSYTEKEKEAIKKVAKPVAQGTQLSGAPTKVLLLKNMVGPGEVDEALEDEVAAELSKYGKVDDVVIYEITEPDFPVEEAVRIFIKFDTIAAATKGVVDLKGRFFGGRTVQAGFFDEDRFESNNLAPLQDELNIGQ